MKKQLALLALPALALAACGGAAAKEAAPTTTAPAPTTTETPTTQVTCGTGTEKVNGVCVAIKAPTTTAPKPATTVPKPTTTTAPPPPAVVTMPVPDHYDLIDMGQISKDPEQFKGQGIDLYVSIFQLDTATGPCSFLGTINTRDMGVNYKWGDVRGQFGISDLPALQGLGRASACTFMAPVVEDDIVHVKATGLGAYTYDTKAGGSNSVPAFRIDELYVVRHGG